MRIIIAFALPARYSTAMRIATPFSTWSKYDGLFAVGHIAGDFHAAVDWAGVHYGDLFIQ